MGKIRQNILLILILAINLAVVLYPTFLTPLPVTQTDGLTYFETSKQLADTGDFFAELQDFIPAKGDEATHINEFLPAPIVYMAGFIKIFGERIVINGGALGILLVLANFYLYLLVKKLTGSRNIALITTLFNAINFRLYFLLFGGNWANVCAMAFSIPAIYYYLEYLEKNKKSSLILVSCSLILVAGSHTVQFLFTICLMIGLWIGIKVLKNARIKLPEIKFDLGVLGEKTISTIIYTILISVVAFMATFIPFVLAGTRTYWVSEWIDYLKFYDKVPQFWHYGIITDGPVLIILGFAGFIYAFYKQNWKILGLAIPSFIIVNLTNFLVPDEIWLSLFVYRYQAFHFIILTILTAYLAFEMMKSVPKLKKICFAILTVGVLWQAALLGLLVAEIEPAITQDELASAQYLNDLGADFWLVNNISGASSFRSYEWILAYGDGNKENVSTSITEELFDHDYLMIQDGTVLSQDEIKMLEGIDSVFEQGVVSIYKND
ncbi:MAG: hypothetical protein ACD_51C00315G0006 [uncultured bacterium]|nr:MAG: hypothetical protein ACD_51C00315G0006 [uncultured bacterium]OGJ47063.1 MAG: hypothetical protein A2244_04985 [Candidatus Peregrinibacteria bacterium RIFOXYA2_FULL_41_18]OGJ49751.1 MAG: hypothetical protein A2344_03645 [Candidatus Peregrinibacteria bacterium RIFOXYB12_FULL_41_12]OGJ52640.1 MAG: hypothetical protein A2448_00225 [Candidatus Peregrinibacteria bacterium RIFOXYC2_FULL_41_22]OGJ54098.1 MAG: hypothetical protein A2336_03780 [Candidatus Peregrinibacteria bacterium RIFOXYB2_FULL